MRFKSFSIAIIFIVILFNYSYAQDKFGSGYYIDNKGDSVKGLIEYQNNYGASFDFKTSIKSKSRRITFIDANQFGFIEGPKYSKLDFGFDDALKSPVFALVLFDGAICDLYKDHTRFYIDGGGKNRFMLAKGKSSNDSEVLKNYQENSGYFNILFNDCPEVKSEASKVAIRSEDLIQLLKNYHNCKSETYVIDKWTKKRIVNFGFYTGMSITRISYSTINDPNYRFLERSKFEPSTDLTLGISIVPQPRKPSSKMVLQHEFSYQKAAFDAETYNKDEIAGYTIIETSKTAISYSMLRYKIGPRITIRSNKLNPYIAFGIQMRVSGSSKQNSMKTSQTNDSPIETVLLVSPLTYSGIWTSIGLNKKIAKRHFLFVEISNDLKVGNSSQGRVSGTSYKMGFLF